MDSWHLRPLFWYLILWNAGILYRGEVVSYAVEYPAGVFQIKRIMILSRPIGIDQVPGEGFVQKGTKNILCVDARIGEVEGVFCLY